MVKETVLKIVCQKWLVGSNPTVGASDVASILQVNLLQKFRYVYTPVNKHIWELDGVGNFDV